MKQLWFLLCVVAVQGFAVENLRVKRKSELPVPKFTSVVTLDPKQVKLEWTAIKSLNSVDSVAYKLKVWEAQKTIIYKYVNIDGVKKLVQETLPAKSFFDLIDDPIDSPPTWEYVTDKTEYLVKHLKMNTEYMFRVQAFTKTEQSAMSKAVTVMLISDDHSRDFYRTD